MIYIGITISLVAGIYELFTRQMGIIWIPYSIINPLALLIPRLAYYACRKIRQIAPLSQIRRLELFGTLVIAINIPGSLFLHAMGIQYDRILHLSMGALIYFYMSLLVSMFYEKPENNKKKIIIYSSILVFSGLFLFEYWQFTADRIFGTHLFFDVRQNIAVDFMEDIVFGTFGLSIALVYVYSRFNSFITRGINS